MKKYNHLKEKVLKLRYENRFSIREIFNRIKVSKSTIRRWLRDNRDDEKNNEIAIANFKKANLKFEKLRQDAYQEAMKSAKVKLSDKYFRDFVILFMTEGYRKSRNQVSICNSNPFIMKLSNLIIVRERNKNNSIDYTLQCHVDNNELNLKKFWGEQLEVSPEIIKVIRKSNSGNLKGRQWRSENGVLAVRCCDTYFRVRLEAYMDYIKKEWNSYITGDTSA